MGRTQLVSRTWVEGNTSSKFVLAYCAKPSTVQTKTLCTAVQEAHLDISFFIAMGKKLRLCTLQLTEASS